VSVIALISLATASTALPASSSVSIAAPRSRCTSSCLVVATPNQINIPMINQAWLRCDVRKENSRVMLPLGPSDSVMPCILSNKVLAAFFWIFACCCFAKGCFSARWRLRLESLSLLVVMSEGWYWGCAWPSVAKRAFGWGQMSCMGLASLDASNLS
jgi:hypothetical protein